MVHASLNLSARGANSSIYYCQKYNKMSEDKIIFHISAKVKYRKEVEHDIVTKPGTKGKQKARKLKTVTEEAEQTTFYEKAFQKQREEEEGDEPSKSFREKLKYREGIVGKINTKGSLSYFFLNSTSVISLDDLYWIMDLCYEVKITSQIAI